MATRIAAIVAALGAGYEFAARKTFTLEYAFTANLWVGVTILTGGLVVFITPTFLLIRKSPLIDHTTYGTKFTEERERKHRRAYELIYTGVGIISISAAVQLVVWAVRNLRQAV